MILQVFILILGFVMLVKGADWFVEGAAGIAKKMGIPQLIIGLTIVAMGTSMPEAAVSITAALDGNAGITVGNIVGSNVRFNKTAAHQEVQKIARAKNIGQSHLTRIKCGLDKTTQHHPIDRLTQSVFGQTVLFGIRMALARSDHEVVAI